MATFLLLLLLSSLGGSTAGLDCLNGGTYDGVKCICPPTHYGPRCEESLEIATPLPTRATSAATGRTTSTASTPTMESPTATSSRPSSPTPTKASPGPCLNGGLLNGSLCLCPPGFWGPLCASFDHKGCQNGGIWAGTSCRCARDFWGPKCEFVVNVIEVSAEAEAWLDLTVQVTNRNFTAELTEPSSQASKDFAQVFTQQVQLAYQKVPGYHNLTVLQLRPGSILVHHRVRMLIPLSANVEAAFGAISEQLVAAFRGAAQQQSCPTGATPLCFNASYAERSKWGIATDEAEICRQNVPAGFGPHFSGHATQAGFQCVTQCAQGYQDSLDCKHGQCQVPRSGPRCSCPETAVFWFWGTRCDVRISKVGLGIGGPLAIAVAAAVALAVVQVRK
ncbi:mucin-3A [Hemicordylus capensis]|uniref:mucin-3A n=1 Tax=Hemicordylus capensis TaxID=884348 RepID=UPI0023046D99|nr:mucin-3A [Hemicordylus capensis]